jgi:putative ABC transport system permease protein
MNEIFGVPMTSIMTVLLVMLAICLVSILWIAIRRTMMFKIGIRNIPRRPAETVLVIVGLMLSTLIIAAALGTGDTIDYSATAATYEGLGEADELVVYSQQPDGEGDIASSIRERIPQSVTSDIEELFADSDLVDGVMPLLIETVPVFLFEGGPPPPDADFMALAEEGVITQSEPSAYLGGIDTVRLDQFEEVRSVDGDVIPMAELGETELIISERMADDLDAEVGDGIGFAYGNTPYMMTIAAIAEDSPLSGQFDQSTPGMAMDLTRMQTMLGIEDEITAVAVSNRGDLRSGMDLTDEVTDIMREAFAGRDLGVDPIKQDSIDFANLISSVFTTFFLLFGLFSIGVGILLIILIFSMLAAERRPEMGMTRAVGAQRAQLIQSFVAEGTVYALFAGLVGAVLGIGAAFAIATAMGSIFGEFIEIQPHVTLKSMVVAYCLGVVITFIAVVVASFRISRLNIVAAVRDIPDVVSPVRNRRTLIWAALALIIGVLSTVAGLSGDSAFPAYLGLSLLPFGIGLILRYLGISSRLIFTVISIYLLVLWLLPDDWSRTIFGDLNGDIEMFFLSGVFLVAGSTVLIVQNMDVLLAGFSKIGGIFRGALPAFRTAIAFPSQAPTRTGMTIAMFSLIVFSMVVFATINENFVNIFLGDDANAGWNVRADQEQSNPIGDTDDFLALLESRGVDTSVFTAVGAGTTMFQTRITRPGDDPGSYISHGIDETLINESTLEFQARAEGYDSDEAIIEALRADPTVAVIDSFAIPASGDFGADDNQFTLDDPDGDGPQQRIETDMETFVPIPIEVLGANGEVLELTIIGIIDQKIGSMFGLYAADSVMREAFPNPPLVSYFIKLEDDNMSEDVALAIEEALLINGVDAVSITDELEDSQSQNRAFLYIIQGFMGLGLLVGLAAVGVIAFRAVVERRQQIGVLRAIGFQPGMVSLSFLAEQAFVVGLGALSGSILGLALSKILFMSEDFAPTGADFLIPWEIVIAILIVTFVAAMLMTIIPARQASKLAPAEALRYE